MDDRTSRLSRIGEWRAISGLGVLYVALAVGWGGFQFVQGLSPRTLLVLGLMMVIPGSVLAYGGYWLSQGDLDTDLHGDVVRWCLTGIVAMALLVAFSELQPQNSVTPPGTSVLILTAIGGVGGLVIGVYDGQAKMRDRQLDERSEALKQAQEDLDDTVSRLEESNDRLERQSAYTEHVLDGIRDIFYVIDEEGSLQRWNDSLREVTGYSDEQIESMNAVEFFAESERSRIADAVIEGFEAGSTQLEVPMVTADGEEIPYEFDASTLQNPEGETVLAGIGRDVSDRVERERELERRACQQQVVADLGQAALDSDDLDGLLARASKQVAAALDADYGKVLELDAEGDELLLRQGVGWDDGLVGEATVSAREDGSQAAATLTNDGPVVVADLQREDRFDGPALLTDHGVQSGISTVIGPPDEPWGVLGVHTTEYRSFSEEDAAFVRSVASILAAAVEGHAYQTELERLVADLESSNERLEQFAYAASHDLQEPLRMVSSYLQLLDRRYGEELDEEATEYLDFAVDGADRMREMIDRLLRYSRVETEGEPMEAVELDDVLADARDDLQVAIDEHDAAITAESLPRVEGDRSQLGQLFRNLLDNAIEYSGDEPPAIEITAERTDGAWTVTVSDDGIGIDPDDQERVFEVFQRAHGRRESAGSGIGLALCQRIVERHDGEIWVESAPDEGAAFSFTLPAADDVGDTVGDSVATADDVGDRDV